jgi:protein gp37
LTREGGFMPWPDSFEGPELWLGDIDWIIVGGESGPHCRRFDEQWARDLIEQAHEAGTAVHVKQMGSVWARQHGVKGKAENPDEWPPDLRVREWPRALVTA